MAISVKDIQEKVFPTQTAGGYDIEQVDDFLDEIAESLSALIRENLALTAQVTKLDEALTAKEAELSAKDTELAEAVAKTPDYNEAGYFKNLESAMRESLIGAQRLADETTAAAKAEADRMVSEAAALAEKTVSDAKAEAAAVTERATVAAAEMKTEFESLKASAETYRASFRKLLEEQLQALKANDILFK